MGELTIVGSAGALFIGVKKEASEQDTNLGTTFLGSSGVTLLNPRMILANQEERQISLARCIGNPSTINITGTINFQYPNEDVSLAEFYKCETEGYPTEMRADNPVEPSKIIQLHS